MKIVVIGGGISGQLFQWAVPEADILDWRAAPRRSKYLTRHYGANYLWQPIDGIPCRPFKVITHIDNRPATEETIRAYKAKVGKEHEVDTGFLLNSQFATETVGFEFTELPDPRVTFGARVTDIDLGKHQLTLAAPFAPVHYDVLATTIPMYSLLSLCGWSDPGLRYKPIWVKITPRPLDAPCPEDAMYVNYLSNPSIVPYRYTDRNGERHFESLEAGPITTGVPDRRIVPGKTYPHPAVPDILSKLAKFHVFCFGRFATWDSEELVHDTWDKIQMWKAASMESSK